VAAVVGAGSGAGGGGGGVIPRPIITARPATAESRKRNSFIAGLDTSPGSVESPDFDGADSAQQQDEERRQPIKRACNECRQQKVRRLHHFPTCPFPSPRLPIVFLSRSTLGTSLFTVLHNVQRLIASYSFAAMWCKILSPSAPDVAGSTSRARCKKTSSELAKDRAMRKWKERLLS